MYTSYSTMKADIKINEKESNNMRSTQTIKKLNLSPDFIAKINSVIGEKVSQLPQSTAIDNTITNTSNIPNIYNIPNIPIAPPLSISNTSTSISKPYRSQSTLPPQSQVILQTQNNCENITNKTNPTSLINTMDILDMMTTLTKNNELMKKSNVEEKIIDCFLDIFKKVMYEHLETHKELKKIIEKNNNIKEKMSDKKMSDDKKMEEEIKKINYEIQNIRNYEDGSEINLNFKEKSSSNSKNKCDKCNQYIKHKNKSKNNEKNHSINNYL